MDVDLSRLPTGTSGWRSLVEYALTLGDLAEVDWLELKGTLPFGDKQERKRSAGVLSRAVLGMANRMPDVAQHHLAGFGVVLVGIDAQRVVGAEQVDGAVLRDAMQPYVGDDGPRWDYQFIDHPTGLVLALNVDPPGWGDRIHACRKDYFSADGALALRDGQIFVRPSGLTRPAKSHDLAQLERRRTRAPHAEAEVSVGYDSTFDRVVPENVRELIEDSIDHQARALLSGLPSPRTTDLYGSAAVTSLLEQVGGARDRRSVDEFRAEVAAWEDESRALIATVEAEFYRYYLARGSFLVRNESDRYLEGVRVQIYLPHHAAAFMASDTSYCDHGDPRKPFQLFQLLPERPIKYGSDSLARLKPFTRPVIPNSAAITSPFTVEETAQGHAITWHVGDLPSRGIETGGDSFAIISDDHADEVHATWRVTARGVHHVFTGDFRLVCGQEPGLHLAFNRGERA